MTLPRFLALFFLALATLAALALAHCAPQHRPAARGLALLLAIDVARLASSGHPAGSLAWQVDVGLCAGWWPVTVGIVVGALWRRSGGDALSP